MLEFGSAEVRLKLNTDDYDKSLKAIQSDDRCVEICADLNAKKLNDKLKKASDSLDCLDLCVDLDTSKLQKSLADIQKNFQLTVQAEVDVSTKQAERSLKELEGKAGTVTAMLQLQTADAMSQLSEFKGELESARVLSQDLTASFTAQIEQTINTSSLERSLRSAAQEFRDSGKDIGEAVADEVGKAEVKTKGSGLLGGIFKGVQEGVGFKIANQIDKDLKEVLGKSFGDFTVINKALKGIKAPVDLVLSDDQLRGVVDEISTTLTRPFERIFDGLGQGILRSVRSADKPLETFANEFTGLFTADNLVQDFNKLKSDSIDIAKNLGQALVSGEALKKFRQSFSEDLQANRRSGLERNIPAVLDRAAKLEEDPKSATRLTSNVIKDADGKIIKDEQGEALRRSVDELILVIGGLGGFGGKTSLGAAAKVSEIANENQRVVSVRNKDSDFFDTTKTPVNKIQSFAAGAAPSLINGISNDTIEVVSKALVALRSNPEIKVKILGESFGGVIAREAQDLLNLLGFEDRVQSLGAGTAQLDTAGKTEGFKAVLSPDDRTLGSKLDADQFKPASDIVDALENVAAFLFGVEIPETADLSKRAFEVGQQHLIDSYLQAAELQNFLFGLPQALNIDQVAAIGDQVSKFEGAVSGETSLKDSAINPMAVPDLVQNLRRQFDVLEGEALDNLKQITFDLEASYFKLFSKLPTGLKSVESETKFDLAEVQKLFKDGSPVSASATKEVRDSIEIANRDIEAIGRQIKTATGSTKFELELLQSSLISLRGQFEDLLIQSGDVTAISSRAKKLRAKQPKTQQVDQRQVQQKSAPAADQLSKARKAAGQELQILTGQLKNAREQNISTLAFEVVNSLKNLNVQIFKTEQALQGLQAPDFKTPELPQFNEAVLGASELLGKIRGEFDSLFMGVADLNQRIRNQRLPDLLGTTETPTAGGNEEGFNKVIQSLSSFGEQVESADSSLGVQFLGLRDTFRQLRSSLGNADFQDNLNKASLSLFEFSKNADITDPKTLDSFAAVGSELQKFEKGLKEAKPQQTSEGDIGASLRELAEEANKSAMALKEAGQKANAFEPPDLGKFIEAPFKTLREEVSRTAQVFGIATNETTVFGGAAKQAREGLESIAKAAQENVNLDTGEVKSELKELATGLKKVRQETFDVALRFEKTFKSQNFSQLAGQFSNDIADSLEQIKKTATNLARDLIVFESLQSDLNALVPNVLKAVEGTVNAARLNAAIFERTGPTIAGINEDLSSFNNNVGRNLAGLAEELPRAVGSFEGLTDIVVLLANATEVLRQKIELIQSPESMATTLEPLFNRLIAKIDEISVGESSAVKARELEPVLADIGPSLGDPQTPASGGTPDIAQAVSTGNSKLDEITANVEAIRNQRVANQEMERAQRQRDALGGEFKANLEKQLGAVDLSSARKLADIINENTLRKDFVGNERFDELRSKVAPVDTKIIKDSLDPAASKKAINKANLLIRRILNAALDDPILASVAEKALRDQLESINVDLRRVAAGEIPAFQGEGRVQDFVGNRFNKKIGKALSSTLDGQPLDISQFISGESVQGIAKEYSGAIESILKEVRKLVATEELFEGGTEAIKDQIAFLKELQGAALEVTQIIDKVSDGPLVSTQEKKSLTGSKNRFNQVLPQVSDELLPSLKLSAGILPSTAELEKLLDTVSSTAFQDALRDGDEITRGLVLGIKKGLPLVDASGNDLAQSLIDAVEDKLEINSPSEVFKRLMRFVVQGVEVGLDAGKNKVQSAFNDLVDFNKVKKNIDVGEPVQARRSSGAGVRGLDGAEETTQKVSFGFSTIGEKIRELQSRFPILQNLKGLISDIAIGFGSLIGVFSAGDILVELFRNSITAAKELQRTTNALTAAIGSTVKAAQGLRSIEMISKDLNISLVAARDGFKQLSASAKSTELTGEVSGLFEGVSTAASALQLAPEQVDRAFTAIGQIISKGVVSQEELRQQLSEAIPGSIQIFADALGVPVPKLNELIESGGLLSKDILPAVGRQFRLEFASSIAQAADSLPALDQRLKNSTQLLQENLGQGAIPLVSSGLRVLTGAVDFLNDRGGVLLSDFIGGALVAFASLNARFGILGKTASFLSTTIGAGFRQSIGPRLRVELAQTNAGLANTSGFLAKLPLQAKKAGVLAQAFGKIGAQIGSAAAKGALFSLAFQGILEIGNQLFSKSQFVEDIEKSGEALDVLNKKLAKTGENIGKIQPPDNLQEAFKGLARLNFADTTDSLTKAALDFDKGVSDRGVPGGFGSKGSQDLIGSQFNVGPISLLPATKDQREAQQILIAFAKNQDRLGLATQKAGEALKEFRKTGVAPAFEDIESFLSGIEPVQKQLEGFKEAGKTDARSLAIFEQLGGDAALGQLQKTTTELKSLNKNAEKFAGTLIRLSSTLKDLELEELQGSTKLAEDLAKLGSDSGLDASDLKLGFAQDEVDRLEKTRDTLAERLVIEQEILQTEDFRKRLAQGEKSAVDQADKVENTEKEILKTRSDLANKTRELLKEERDRALSAIDLLSLEKELALAKTRTSRTASTQEFSFTGDLDQLSNLDAIEKAQDRLAEFRGNGSEQEVLNAEKALTDAIAKEEDRRLDIRKRNREARIEFTKVSLNNESAIIAQELNNREITQVQADEKLSSIRQRELANNIKELEAQRMRLQADFALSPGSDADSAQAQEQLNTINQGLIDATKSLFEEQTNFRIAQEDKFLEKAQKAADTLIQKDKAKTDALIRNIQQVDGASESLIRTLDRQEKSIQSQFDLINAQQGRASQRIDVAVGRNDDAGSALNLLNQEKGIRDQISDLRRQSLNVSDEEKEGIKEQSRELEQQVLTTKQQTELRRQLRETTGSSFSDEQGLLKSRIQLEENATRQRAEALAAELSQERLLLEISLKRDQLAAKAATRQAQQGVLQSQFQATEQQQGILGIQREISIAEGRGETGQADLLRSQLDVAREGLELTRQQIGLSGGVLRDSQLAELDLSSLAENALKSLRINQESRVEGFFGEEDSRRRQFNLSTIQSGGEDFISGRGIGDARDRLGGFDSSDPRKTPAVESSEKLVNSLVNRISQSKEAQGAAIKELDTTVRVVGELVIGAIERNAIKLPKQRTNKRQGPPRNNDGLDDLRGIGL